MQSQLTNVAGFSLLALAVVWFAYPLAIWALAGGGRRRRRPVPPTDADGAPSVSVIVATRDDPAAIRERVADILATTYPGSAAEVIVALDAARDYEDVGDLIPSRHDGGSGGAARVVRGDAPGGKACALNAAVREAKGDILVFTDIAQRFDPSAIPQLVAGLRDYRYGAVSGALRTSGGEERSLADWYWRFERWLRREEARLHSTVGVTGAIYAMRRALWRPLRPGVLCDDLYVPMDLVLRGERIGFCEGAVATDVRRFSAPQEYARKVRTLTGVLQTCAWLPGVLVPRRNPIWIQFVCHKLLRLLTPYLLLIVAGAALGAAVLAIGGGANNTGRWLALAALGALLGLWALSARTRSAIAMALAMQYAVLRATWNGLRGDWNVWRR
ncbi:MAG: glycosyltransferase [Gemmatimonadaceae bacterium]